MTYGWTKGAITLLFQIIFSEKLERVLAMNDARNFFVWLIFMAIIYVVLAVLETALEVPDIGWVNMSVYATRIA